MSEESHGDQLQRQIASDPETVARFLYETYGILKRVHNRGDWNEEYHDDACKLWNELGDWMYPEEDKTEKPASQDVRQPTIVSQNIPAQEWRVLYYWSDGVVTWTKDRKF